MVWEMEDKKFTTKNLPHSPETDWWTDSLLGRQPGSISLRGADSWNRLFTLGVHWLQKKRDVETTLIWQTFNGVLHKTVCHKMTWKICFSKAVWETNRKQFVSHNRFFLVFFFFIWVCESKASTCSFVLQKLMHVLPILLNVSQGCRTHLYRFSSATFVCDVRC